MIPIRDELPTGAGPRGARMPIVTYALIALNALVFAWESLLPARDAAALVADWGLVPARFVHAPFAELGRLFSSMFLHAPASFWHLGGNMLFLWVFGDNVEAALGRRRFIAFYLLAGVCAGLAQVLVSPHSPIPMVGASGAIAGVLAAYGSLYPRVRVVVLNPVLPLWLLFGPTFRLPAWFVILEFFALNLVNGMATLGQRAGGVAFFAHIGGFLAGLVAVRFLLPRAPSDPGGGAPNRWDGWRPPGDRPDAPDAASPPVWPRYRRRFR